MSPRKKEVISAKSIPRKVENSWLMLGTDSLFENSSFTIITLPHPSSRIPSKYCLDEEHCKVYEVVTFDEPYRSWFIGETVKSDGKIMILSPMDPVFLVLPKLKEECSNKAIPLEDLLSERGFDKIVDFITDLSKVADMKGSADIKAYRYNEEKTLSWLTEKVHKLARTLRDKKVHVKSGAVSATFVSSCIETDHIDEEFYLKYAHGIISEYLPEDISVALANKFNFKTEIIETLGNKRKSDVSDLTSNKKIKHNSSDTDIKENDYLISNQNGAIEMKKEKPLSAKEKARQKAASKTKTISSFFTKK